MKIMLDMDGVLCDYDYWLDYNDARNEKGRTNWKKLHQIGSAFWANMPWKVDGHKLYTMLLSYIAKHPEIEIGIHSAVGMDCGKIGKRYWLEKNCPEIPEENIKLDNDGHYKFMTGAEDEILVDDRQENVDKYIEFGFPAVLFTTPEETFFNIVKLCKQKNKMGKDTISLNATCANCSTTWQTSGTLNERRSTLINVVQNTCPKCDNWKKNIFFIN